MDKFRNGQFVSAVVFLLTAASFTFDNHGIQWMWKDNPVLGAILAAVSLAFWVSFARRTLKDPRGEIRG